MAVLTKYFFYFGNKKGIISWLGKNHLTIISPIKYVIKIIVTKFQGYKKIK